MNNRRYFLLNVPGSNSWIPPINIITITIIINAVIIIIIIVVIIIIIIVIIIIIIITIIIIIIAIIIIIIIIIIIYIFFSTFIEVFCDDDGPRYQTQSTWQALNSCSHGLIFKGTLAFSGKVDSFRQIANDRNLSFHPTERRELKPKPFSQDQV